MTPDQLLHLRKNRGETRAELAAFLGGISASAIVQWEGGSRKIPEWVAEKLLRSVPVTLPLEELARLLDIATQTNQDFQSMLITALRDYIANQRKTKVHPIVTDAETSGLRAAEDTTPYKAGNKGRSQI